MHEIAKTAEKLVAELKDLPPQAAEKALEKFADRLEGYAEGFAAAMAMKEAG